MPHIYIYIDCYSYLFVLWKSEPSQIAKTLGSTSIRYRSMGLSHLGTWDSNYYYFSCIYPSYREMKMKDDNENIQVIICIYICIYVYIGGYVTHILTYSPTEIIMESPLLMNPLCNYGLCIRWNIALFKVNIIHNDWWFKTICYELV